MEVEYLQQYYPFSDDVMATVEEVAAGQKVSWPEYMASRNLPDLKVFEPRDSKRIQVWDIIPKDYSETFVYHMPMGCLLDANTMSHVATLAAAEPEARIISVANPGQPGLGTGKLRIRDLWGVQSGNLKATVTPTLEYVNSEGIDSVIHVGESYGADKAAVSAVYSADYDQKVTHTVMTEPTSVKNRGLIRIGLAFMQTGKHAEKYLLPVRTISKTFVDAERLRESAILYPAGLARLSNLAIGKALGRVGFEERLDFSMFNNPEMQASVIWGSESELAVDGLVRTLVHRIGKKYPDRVHSMRLVGQTHAMNLDIFLNTAIVLQSLQNQQKSTSSV